MVIPPNAAKEIRRLSQTTRHRILEAIAELSSNPRPRGCKKLRGKKNEYRIRVGRYRVVYGVDDVETKVVILHCVHRRNAYR
ncbi:type II toxin-antitoxin system RelE/ParE family toxin [bacterium]|nr:type II toxin-antitoxin system RelE/ParE family toxin [bacterium]